MKLLSTLSIALGALCATAAAEDITLTAAEDYSYTAPVGGNFYAGNFSFDFALSEGMDLSTETLIAAYGGSNLNGSLSANMFAIQLTDAGYTLTAGRGQTNWSDTAASPTSYSFSENKSTATALTLSTDTVYTVSVVGTDQSQTVTLMQGDTTITTLASYNGNMNNSVNGNMNTRYNQAFNPNAVTPVVPEPTTATLSLLALAGLAARRRRK